MTAIGSLAADYAAITERCGLLDRSEHGKLALSGADAKTFLHGQVTQDITGLEPGHGRYAALLTNKGKMLADLRVLDAGSQLLIHTERAGLQELFNTIRRFCIGYDVTLHKRTLESGLLSLLGPASETVLGSLVGTDALPGPEEHDHLTATVGAAAVRLIRTDLGIDVLCEAADAEPVAQALVDAGASPVSLAAAECLRIESGRPRYGVDLVDGVIPQEAGLNERAVSFTKGCYVGQETVARLFYRGKPNRELRGLRSGAPLTPGTELLAEDRVVGVVTSASVSPRLGPVALALVRREAPVGTRLSSGAGESVEVVALPFTPDTAPPPPHD